MTEARATKVICVKCKHCWHEVENKMAPRVWYNYRCGHPSALRERFDYTLGHDESEQAFCRDINPFGDCKLYTAS